MTGHVVSVSWFVATQLGWLSIHFTVVAGLLLGISLVAAWAWQFLEAEGGRRVLPEVGADEAMPRDVRWIAALLVAATVVIVAVFW